MFMKSRSDFSHSTLRNMNETFHFPFDSHIFGRIHNYTKSDVQSTEARRSEKLPQLYSEDDIVNKFKTNEAVSFPTEYHNLDALFHDSATQPHPYDHQMQELADIESQYSELIKPHRQIKRTETSQTTTYDPVPYVVSGGELSTDAIIRLGGERFIQSSSSSSSSSVNDISHPYSSSFSGFSDREVKDIQLIENLLLSAEKVSQQQFERSVKLLDWCDMLSSISGNPIQRIVRFFSKALREKIGNETGRISCNGIGKKHVLDIEEKMLTPNPTTISIYQKSPIFQAGQFSGVQALVDGVVGSKKVHIIDLSIKNGVQHTLIMQALASQHDCPIEHVTITAIGTNFKRKIEQTGDRLRSFADSLRISFSFHVVIVDDMLDFKPELLKLDPEEALAVFSSYGLWNMILRQDRLERLMKAIKSVNPRVMVVSEVAANLNSPNFVNRFIEALFFYGGLFDSLEDCMGREDENRYVIESAYLGFGIRSIVAEEGAERAVRHVAIDVWRKFFAQFGMKEVELSMSALYQANLIAEKLPCGSSCTFDMDGKSLIIGWKGVPIQSLSAWRFS